MSEEAAELTRAEVSSYEGAMLLEFGAAWCGYCRALAPVVEELAKEFPEVSHVKIEDGPGKPLGRSFQVKLWPTLVFVKDGVVKTIAVRPGRAEVLEGFRAVTSG